MSTTIYQKPTPERGLYILKALCALLVVINHVPILGRAEIEPFYLTAVPCFFIISGFFLYRNDKSKELQCAWRWCKKIFITATLINLFYCVFLVYRGPFQITNFRLSFLTGDTLMQHLWYLTAMWESMLLFLIIRRFLPARIIYLLPFLLILHFLSARYHFLITDEGGVEPQWVRLNFLTVATPCISIGYLLRKHIAYFKGLFPAVVLFIIFTAGNYTENWLLTHFHVNNGVSYNLFTTPMAIGIFLIFKNLPVHRDSFISDIGRYHSANIYYFHIFIWICVRELSTIYDINIKPLAALIVYIATILFSIILRAAWKYTKRVYLLLYKR